MNRRWTDDEQLMNWWWTDDELMINWWWTGDELMMNWWWTDDELMMNLWRTDELVWSAKDYHRLPQTITDYHILPQTTTDYHRLPQTATDWLVVLHWTLKPISGMYTTTTTYIPDSTYYKSTASGANSGANKHAKTESNQFSEKKPWKSTNHLILTWPENHLPEGCKTQHAKYETRSFTFHTSMLCWCYQSKPWIR